MLRKGCNKDLIAGRSGLLNLSDKIINLAFDGVLVVVLNVKTKDSVVFLEGTILPVLTSGLG